MTTSPLPLTRCSSQDLTRTYQAQKGPSPTPSRSNSFVLSRRCGIVSEQDVLRLAAATAFDDDKRVGDPRQPPRNAVGQTVSSPWPAPMLRKRSSEARPRPLSTGYLPSNIQETQAQQRIQGQASQTVKADGVDTQVRLQNVAILPNRQLIQQPADNRWRQWNNTPQRKGRPFGDINPTTTPENGWLPTAGSSGGKHYGTRPNEQPLLTEREAELRLTMEKNERAILRAMDDKQREWKAEADAERKSWESRLLDAERQIQNVRETLTERIRDLELENAKLQLSNVELTQRNRGHSGAHLRSTANNDEELATARSQRPDDEASDVRSSFKQLSVNGVDERPYAARNLTRGSTTSSERTASNRSTAEQRRVPPPTELNSESTGPDAAASRLPAIPEGPVTRCQRCEAMSSEVERAKQEFEAERQQWLAEKDKVITYQKLLQNEYNRMKLRCAELERLTATDSLNHVESAGRITPGSIANGHAVRGARNFGQTQSSSSSTFLQRLIPCGQTIET